MISMTIDGRTIEVPVGITVLQAARQNGIEIPTLCDHPALEPYGGCRLCLVEVKGFRTLVTSCTLPVSTGLEVKTDTPAIRASRKFILDMLFSERNHFCMYCEKTAGDCELQNAAYAEDMTHWPLQPTWKSFPVDASHPHFVIDHNRCILCRRCVRACADLVGAHALSLENRGAQTMLVAGIGGPISESSCIRCGTCYQVCPTGAIVDRRSAYLAKDAQTQRTSTVCVGCSVGCGIETVAHEGKLIRIEGDWSSPVNGGVLCEQGRYFALPNGGERLAAPLVRKNGELQPASWEEAIAAAAAGLQAAPAAGLVSTRLPAEALYAFKSLFDGQGSRQASCIEENLVSTSELPFDSGEALEALKTADCCVVLGADLGESHPVAGSFIRRRLQHGAELVLIDTAENSFSELTWHNLRLAPGSDALVLDALQAVLAQLGALKAAAPVEGSAQALLTAAVQASGLSLEALTSAARAVAAAQKPVFVVGKGLTRPENAPALLKAAQLAELLEAPFVNLSGKANSKAAQAYGLDRAFAPVPGSPVFVALGDDHPTPRLLQNLAEASFLVVGASCASELTARADVVLPVEAWYEQEGHYLNLAGRLQKASRSVSAPAGVWSSQQALQELAECMGIEPAANWQDALPVIRNS